MASVTAPERFSPAELVGKHQAGIWRYLRFLGCNETEADDLTQDTFLAALDAEFEQRGPTQTAAYLRRVARNKYFVQLRRLQCEPALGDFDVADEVWNRVANDDAWAERLNALDDCLEQLSTRAKYAISLRYRHNQSREAMAEALQITSHGVKTLLRRTRDALRQCVEKKVKT